jgi:hypothetical protein
MLPTMHGMLSSAVVLAAFAVIAGAGGYVAVWLFRASPGGPARSRPAPEPDASAQAAQPAGGETADRTVEADGTGWPHHSAVADDAVVLDGSDGSDGSDGVDGSHMADEFDEPAVADDAGENEGTGWPESAGARIYVLGRPRTPSR